VHRGAASVVDRKPRRSDRGGPYLLGQFLCAVVDVDEDDDVEVEDFADGVAVAACAIAAVPPMRAPDTVRAATALRI